VGTRRGSTAAADHEIRVIADALRAAHAADGTRSAKIEIGTRDGNNFAGRDEVGVGRRVVGGEYLEVVIQYRRGIVEIEIRMVGKIDQRGRARGGRRLHADGARHDLPGAV
jgi:hypothetical protein